MFDLTDAQARDVLPRAETVLEIAAIIARLPDPDLLNLHAVLAADGGNDQIVALLRRFAGLPENERDVVLTELAKLVPPSLHRC